MLITVGFVYPVLIRIFDTKPELALIMSLALSFSGTVVAAKVLESKRELRGLK